jgi:putative membrane protein
VGIVGTIAFPANFLPLSGVTLTITTVFLLLFGDKTNGNFWRFVIFVFAAGFALEMVGVQSGKLFGVYYYGDNLGFKLKNVPLVIGLNWVFLTLCSLSIASKISENFYLRTIVGAILMVMLDALIEPLAGDLDFWHWMNDIIPLRNFGVWFIVSFFFNALAWQLRFKKYNEIASFIFILQIVYFLSLHCANFFSR